MLGKFRDALRHRDLRVLVTAFVIDGLGSWAYLTVLLVYIFDRTHSTTWIALANLCRWGPALVLAPYAGVIADRFQRTTVMITSALLSCAAMVGLAMVVIFTGPVALLLVLAGIAACVAAPYRPAAGALTPDVVGEKDLAAANGLLSAVEGLVVVIGPGVGALLLLTGAPVSAFLLNAASFLIAAGLVSRTRVRSKGGAGERGESLLSQLGGGFVSLVHQPVAAVLVGFCALDSAVYGAATVLYVPISQQLGTGSNGFGYLLAGQALGGVLAAGLAAKLSGASRLGPVILGAITLQALPFAVTALVHLAVLGFALQVASGVGMIIVDVLAITAIQRDVPSDVRSRVLSILDVSVLLTILLASFIFAIVYAAFGLATSLIVLGIAFPVVASLGLPFLLRADRQSAAVMRQLAPRVSVLQALDLFAAANNPTLERLAKALQPVELPAGSVVMAEGDPADALWILTAGEVAVMARGEGREERLLRRLGPPAYVGEIGLLRASPRTATVRTVQPSSFWKLPGDVFLSALQDSTASTSLLQTSANRLAASHPRMAATPPPPVPVSAGE